MRFSWSDSDEILIKLNRILRKLDKLEYKGDHSMSDLTDAVDAMKVSVDAAVTDLKALADALAAGNPDVAAAVVSLREIAATLDAGVAANHP